MKYFNTNPLSLHHVVALRVRRCVPLRPSGYEGQARRFTFTTLIRALQRILANSYPGYYTVFLGIWLSLLSLLPTLTWAEVVPPAEQKNEGSEMLNNVDLGDNLAPFDTSNPKESVLEFMYEPERIYKVRIWPGLSTLIRIPEEIIDFRFGNNYSFAGEKITLGNDNVSRALMVYSSHYDTHTYLNVFGKSGNNYTFYLRSDPTYSQYIPHAVVNIKNPLPPQFLKEDSTGALPQEEKIQMERLKASQDLPIASDDYLNKLKEAKNIDTHYRMYAEKGHEVIAPYAVWADDSGRTYFDFREGPSSGVLPALFQVIDGHDAIVHPRYVEGYLIADTLSQAWTLKRGGLVVCVKKQEKNEAIKNNAVPDTKEVKNEAEG